jgi:hypothetical protein
MTARIDLERFERRGGESATNMPSPPPQRPPQRVKGAFLKGPIPLGWLEAAGRLSGKALHVGTFLWYKAGLTKSMTVKPSYEELRRFGVLPDAFQRALVKLEAAGLVTADKHPGRKPRVTIQSLSGSL